MSKCGRTQTGVSEIESVRFLRFNLKFPKSLTLPDIFRFLSCVPQAQNTRFLTSNKKDSTTIDGYRLMLPHKSNPSMVGVSSLLYMLAVRTLPLRNSKFGNPSNFVKI